MKNQVSVYLRDLVILWPGKLGRGGEGLMRRCTSPGGRCDLGPGEATLLTRKL